MPGSSPSAAPDSSSCHSAQLSGDSWVHGGGGAAAARALWIPRGDCAPRGAKRGRADAPPACGASKRPRMTLAQIMHGYRQRQAAAEEQQQEACSRHMLGGGPAPAGAAGRRPARGARAAPAAESREHGCGGAALLSPDPPALAGAARSPPASAASTQLSSMSGGAAFDPSAPAPPRGPLAAGTLAWVQRQLCADAPFFVPLCANAAPAAGDAAAAAVAQQQWQQLAQQLLPQQEPPTAAPLAALGGFGDTDLWVPSDTNDLLEACLGLDGDDWLDAL
ncbi:MAG: hypothetical protein J3K34DRAFT_500227 [Monoraphidium minutum]|nr:MAG: hypothetical protein J3K34DRAFT_500227 [Monoraphidium minutum]